MPDFGSTRHVPSVLPEMDYTDHSDGRPAIGPFHFDSPRDLASLLKTVYSGHLGFEISHIENSAERRWLYHTIETMSAIGASAALQQRMAKILLESEVFDQFMTKRFGQIKRYGLEGGEAMMIAVDVLVQLTKAGIFYIPPNFEKSVIRTCGCRHATSRSTQLTSWTVGLSRRGRIPQIGGPQGVARRG